MKVLTGKASVDETSGEGRGLQPRTPGRLAGEERPGGPPTDGWLPASAGSVATRPVGYFVAASDDGGGGS